jgi:hypothetical protein
MILKALPQKKKDEFDLIDDIRSIQEINSELGSNYYVHQFPKLPDKFNKTYHSKQEKVNLCNFTCTCQQYVDNSKLFQDRDIRKACKHIYYKASQTWLKDFIPEITLLLLKIAVFGRIKFLYKIKIYSKEIYFLIDDNSVWVKVIAQNNRAVFTEYTYHTIQKRWGYSNIPPDEIHIVDQLQKVVKNQLPGEHPYKIFNELEKL